LRKLSSVLVASAAAGRDALLNKLLLLLDPPLSAVRAPVQHAECVRAGCCGEQQQQSRRRGNNSTANAAARCRGAARAHLGPYCCPRSP
jgi:hypothetical protein